MLVNLCCLWSMVGLLVGENMRRRILILYKMDSFLVFFSILYFFFEYVICLLFVFLSCLIFSLILFIFCLNILIFLLKFKK